MERDNMGRPYLDWKTAEEFITDAFAGVGVPRDEAKICTDILLEADKRGIESHGCNRFKPIYIDRINDGIQQPITNFEIHCPIIYEKDKFESLEQKFYKIKGRHRHFVGVRSYYCNMNGIKGITCDDMKIRKPHMKTWLEKIKNSDCFSTSDDVIKMGVGDWLIKKFPNPSKYEKTL